MIPVCFFVFSDKYVDGVYNGSIRLQQSVSTGLYFSVGFEAWHDVLTT